MGVGKTVQALATAYVYKDEWPLLILTPSTLKFVWRDEIKKWLPMIPKGHIEVIQSSKNAFATQSKVFIMSYDLAKNVKGVLESLSFNIAIADEAHYLKSKDSKRTKILNPVLLKCKRVILVSGTPMLSRPQEIFNITHILRPDLFTKFTTFGKRYCHPRSGPYGTNWNGSDHPDELHLILSSTMMIRRLKSQVLTELPQKQRQRIDIVPDKRIVKEIQEIISNVDSNTIASTISKTSAHMSPHSEEVASSDETMRSNIFKAYTLSGMAKIKGVLEFVTTLIDNEIKFIVFAQHLSVLNELETHLNKAKQSFIRIDGSVETGKRHLLVKEFQENDNCKAALLSITASCQGITLTAASTVVFAEFAWTPGLMDQAEDRVHRISQKNSVNIYYLYAKDTLDPILYRIIKMKNEVIGKTLDGKLVNYKLSNGSIDKALESKGKSIESKEKPKAAKKDLLGYFQFVNKSASKEASSKKEQEEAKSIKVIKDEVQEFALTNDEIEELFQREANDWYASLDEKEQKRLANILDSGGEKAEGKRKRNEVKDIEACGILIRIPNFN
eukprot:TRINITY_DN10581_c0_g1_i4.p1 TRINITY_DN10581_c0_g1~~TRINITY_DN10581_c0_g1_i4.p1  ORF type:complete len:558 (+),score=120.33 TRINITY_DN10581_c0_g1_i4:804-2477(+)